MTRYVFKHRSSAPSGGGSISEHEFSRKMLSHTSLHDIAGAQNLEWTSKFGGVLIWKAFASLF
jgi:hypothetical protein